MVEFSERRWCVNLLGLHLALLIHTTSKTRTTMALRKAKIGLAHCLRERGREGWREVTLNKLQYD